MQAALIIQNSPGSIQDMVISLQNSFLARKYETDAVTGLAFHLQNHSWRNSFVLSLGQNLRNHRGGCISEVWKNL
jgi:hypothetical protein